ncbi:PfkB family carbohydrate kinase [Planomicrobium sp. CPCC 101079]|uniref:PfkB family carbohydrate kinase n=1 Tax=Planomicrobium sp. CPCC 101079 TaxID=2599618 RepID=UPI0011B5406B|nr:PfkB family carbohydrate kinase [Planomicrobium sp. CPCC 101079]TWT13151.1 carbohydrate kinase [Planomicrobium sp. CPCC 101079]
MFDVVALGELLIDFTPAGKSGNGNTLFETNPGGAPANVLATLAKFNAKTAFIGKVGADQFGSFLGDTLKKENIDLQGLVYSEDVNTTLAFVHLSENGDRSFHFYRSPGADIMLEVQEVDTTLVQNTKVFHFGSLSMTHEPVKSATVKAVKAAQDKDVIISYDPNLRPALWKNLSHAKETIIEGMQYADILKISEEELEFITGISDFEEGSQFLHDKFDLKIVLVTLGSKGCFYRFGKDTGHIKGFQVNAVDTTGAGDMFLGSFLYQFIKKDASWKSLQAKGLEEMILFANAAAALGTTKNGAIPAIPRLDEVRVLISGDSKY